MIMRKYMIALCMVLSSILIVFSSVTAYAYPSGLKEPKGDFSDFDGFYKTNEETNYTAVLVFDVYQSTSYIEYKYDLSDDEMNELLDAIYPLTQYTNVAVYVRERMHSEEDIQREDYRLFGNYNDSIMIYYDVVKEQAFIRGYGRSESQISYAQYATISSALTKDIKDASFLNGITKATKGIIDSFEGKKVFNPVKIVSAFFVAVLLSVLINFLIVTLMTVRKKKGTSKILNSKTDELLINNLEVKYITTSKVYNPREKY